MIGLGMLGAALRNRLARLAGIAGGIVAAAAALYAAGRREGRRRSAMAAMQRALRAREIRDAVEGDVARSRDPRDELRRDWRRP